MARIELKEPVVVDLAPQDRQRWGEWQFPKLSRMKNGGIALEFSTGGDAAGNRSLPNKFYSMDDGKTWTQTDEFPSPNGCILKNGDVIRRKRLEVIPVNDLCLPEPEKRMLRDVVFHEYYPAESFPECLKGRWIERYSDGKWVAECKKIEAPLEYICVTEDDLSTHPFGYPGRFLERQRVDGLDVAPNGDVWLSAYGPSRHGDYPFSAASFFVSKDNGKTFTFRSQMTFDTSFIVPAYQHIFDERKFPPGGFSETALAFLPSGTIVCLLRSDDQHPSFIMRSTDEGYTWTRPEPFDTMAVLPGMVVFDNGAVLATYGRPNVRLRVCVDPDGREWEEPLDVLAGVDSCCNNTLLRVGPNEALLAYSHFRWPDGSGGYTKAILVRRVKVHF